MKRILVTGGAGFVGSHLALKLKEHFSTTEVVALDNLKRRGSELSLPRLKKCGVNFVHGDVRFKDDVFSVGKVDLIIDCSAEPSVLAGRDGNPEYLYETNLTGTFHCLELARCVDAKIIFLSTSRVYPIKTLNEAVFTEGETRFELSSSQKIEGLSEFGVSEKFPLQGARSLYGTTKLSSELFAQEYLDTFQTPVIINRCGVLTGPWQMGKIDQGVVVLWVAKHIFGGSLSYLGFNGSGKQVRDLLHVEDLFDLLLKQIKDNSCFNGEIYNVGGGNDCSVSLLELTKLCEHSTKKKITINKVSEGRPGDIPIFLTDSRKAKERFNWNPKTKPADIINEISLWVNEHKVALEPILS